MLFREQVIFSSYCHDNAEQSCMQLNVNLIYIHLHIHTILTYILSITFMDHEHYVEYRK